jgi:hypothetical protein
MTSIFTERAARLIALLRATAEAGQPAPSNRELAQQLGIREILVPAELSQAIAERRIRLFFRDGQRVIEAGDGSWRTAFTLTAEPQPAETPKPANAALADPASNVWRMMRFLARAAAAGQRAPSNDDIAALFGFASKSCATRLLQQAEAGGLILVHRGQASRVIEAADGSWRTAGPMPAPHWRARAAQPQERAA